MKLPTIVALLFLTALVTTAFVFHSYLWKKTEQNDAQFQPQKITTLDITDSSAIVTWETSDPTIGSLVLSTSPSFDSPFSFSSSSQKNDSRDSNKQLSRRVHLVLLEGLSSQITYYYKIQSNNHKYPTQPLTFKTTITLPKATNQWTKAQPIIGTVVDENNQPVSDALVFLTINNKKILATTTTDLGSFILPLRDLAQTVTETTFTAQIIITNNDKQSLITLSLPNTLSPLPQVILGEDQDLTLP